MTVSFLFPGREATQGRSAWSGRVSRQRTGDPDPESGRWKPPPTARRRVEHPSARVVGPTAGTRRTEDRTSTHPLAAQLPEAGALELNSTSKH